ncbi:hypothetical protein LB572_03125 [Mesorhizobium sp. BH1-1-5]|uniref:hypothetical protein n=1 Tax=Mesorhizobium sp. BH1-1-5 TaxID=2876661 RepID=UPI001CCA7AF6|nr:hypothetical protein [Mesorhizobium sp. BH1-1-5]MBZ9986085.1 hypothetical protein [Mesorhizobium sp. BH1-1-5]
MSYEAWGEPDDSAFEAAIEAGWLDPADLSKALVDVMNERNRQQDAEGWTPEHDDEHGDGSLAMVAALYAEPRPLLKRVGDWIVPAYWPQSWDFKFWKPKDRRRDLVRAGALILAEIERLDRLAAKEAGK